MKYSTALTSLLSLTLLSVAVAAPAESSNKLIARNLDGIKQGKPFCSGKDHCLYLGKHAFTYLIDPKSDTWGWWGSKKQVLCESYDQNGHGRGHCQFPNKVATTIECDGTGDIAYAQFGCKESTFKYKQRTEMNLIWSSQKRHGLPAESKTNSRGDDLYVRCHAKRSKGKEGLTDAGGKHDLQNSNKNSTIYSSPPATNEKNLSKDSLNQGLPITQSTDSSKQGQVASKDADCTA